jgi:hypothetical protein
MVAAWTIADEGILIDELISHYAERGDGSTFKLAVFNTVALVVNAKRTKGSAKDGKTCQNKYSAV